MPCQRGTRGNGATRLFSATNRIIQQTETVTSLKLADLGQRWWFSATRQSEKSRNPAVNMGLKNPSKRTSRLVPIAVAKPRPREIPEKYSESACILSM